MEKDNTAKLGATQDVSKVYKHTIIRGGNTQEDMGDREQEVQSHNGRKKTNVTSGGSYYKTVKIHNNLSYCYSCGYYVNHNGWKCHPNTRKRTNIPNVSQDEAHTIAGAYMKAQHKTLPDGSGAGKDGS